MIRKFRPSSRLIESVGFLEEIYKKPPAPIKTEEGLQYTSENHLNNVISTPLDVCEVSMLDHITFPRKNQSQLYRSVSLEYPKCSIILSGNFFYPKNGYMSWHTNKDAPGLRLYLSYTEHENSSFFIYKDGVNIIKDPDYVGWTAREFTIDKDNLLWHSVFAYKPRISAGVRIIKNLL